MEIKNDAIFICLEPYLIAETGEIVQCGDLIEYDYFDKGKHWFVSPAGLPFSFDTEEELKNYLELLK